MHEYRAVVSATVLEEREHNGIATRERYYGSTDINSDDACCLTPALAWFREYWRDELNRKDRPRAG